MKIEVHGVSFEESAGNIVIRLIEHLVRHCGPCHHYTAHNQIKFALRKPTDTKSGRAYRLFLQIKPRGSGALVIRPRPPKSGEKTFALTEASLAKAKKAGETWFDEVKGIKPIIGFQETGSHLILPGGQFESNRSKH